MRGIVVFCLALVLIEAALQYVGMTSKSASDSSQYHAQIPNALPMLVREPNHSAFIADQQPLVILRWVLIIFAH